MNTGTSDQSTFNLLYCPAIGAFIRYYPELGAFMRPAEAFTRPHAHLAERFPWILLSAFSGNSAPRGWVLRGYFIEADQSFYASHRTIPEKTAAGGQLVELFAPPGSYGNDTAGHVPPKEKSLPAAETASKK
jgi:hypothetical protein